MISGIARDIPVSAFFEKVIPGYSHLCMLKIAYSWLLNAQIARTVIWISSWKLYFSSAAAAWLGSRQARHSALAGRRMASAPSQAGGVGGWLARRAPFSLAASAGAADAGGVLLNSSPLHTRLLQGWSERSPDAPSKPTMSPQK